MNLREFNEHRQARLDSMSSTESLDKARFLTALDNQKLCDSVIDITNFAEKIESQEYKHGQLSKSQYLAHPYRLASLLIDYFPRVDESYIKLALCHNIIEVSDVNDSLATYLGDELMDFVRVLTVDRERQWDANYKNAYYGKIGQKKITRVIKVFDKLDNLFTLTENDNYQIKMMYLKEIEKHVLPFVILDMPSLEDYFKTIVKINYDLIG